MSEKGIGNPYETTRIDQIHRDGSVIPTEIVTSVLRNSEGEITRILGFQEISPTAWS